MPTEDKIFGGGTSVGAGAESGFKVADLLKF
jgi:hypothetical protein